MENGKDESTRNLGQLAVSEIQVVEYGSELQHISQRPSLKDLLCYPVEDEYSSVQNSTRDFEGLGVDANAATDEQYSEDPLDEYYERSICRPLLEFKGGSNDAVDKPQWRKKIEGIFAKVGLRQKKQRNLLDVVDLKGLLKGRSKSERKASEVVKQRPHAGRLLCCSSTGGKKGKPKDWEQQLQKYVSEYYSYAW